MAKLPVTCPGCQRQYQVDDTLLGKRARCRACRTAFVLSRPEEPSGVTSSPWPWISGGTVPEAGRPEGEEGVAEVWKPGDVVLDLYEVREVYTSGGMGLVYRVRHRGWNVDLAVKCPRPEFFRHEQDKENFEQEAETWVKLGLHPHTVVCYYVRRLGGIPRVFAEFVAGGTLMEWVKTRRLYAGGPERARERVLDVAIQLAWGLQHAHEQGLIHRDVKPGNVLLSADGVAKVTDFGMARARGGGATAATREEGPQSVLVSAGGLTPAYCSPEQVQGQRVSRKTDVWSWGVSVLEMYAGGPTWSAGYLAGAALEEYLVRGPQDERLPPMPPAVAELLRRCFRRDPEARPADMPEVAAVLRDAYRQAAGRPYPRPAPVAAEAVADSLNNRAVSLLDLKKQDEAERLWEEALTAGPNHPESTYNLGLSRFRSGRITGEGLASKLQEVCASHPGDWLSPFLLAQAYLEQGNWSAAVETLRKIEGPAAALEEVRAALAAARNHLDTSRSCLRVLEGHGDWVSSVALSRDGRLALSGSADGTMRLWETASGRCLRTFRGHTEWVTSVGLSADGSVAASGGADQTLRLWDTVSGQCLRTLRGHRKWVLALALNADGCYCLSGGGDGLIKLWETDTGKLVHSFAGHAGPVLSVSLSRGGRLALSGSRDTTVKLWDVDGGQCVRAFEGHADRVLAVCLTPDSKQALSASGDRTVRVWDVETGRCLRTLEGHSGAVFAVAVSGDGRHVVTGGGDKTVKFWRLAGGLCLSTLEGHAGTVNSVCFGPGGRQALSGSGDKTLRLWALPRDLPAPYLISQVLSSESALAARAEYEQALTKAWKALSAGDAAAAARWLREARAQPGYGRRPEAMNQWAGLYVRLARKGLNGGWEGTTLEGHLDAVTCVAVGGDGRHALSGSADRTLRLWEVATGQCLRVLEGHGSVVTAVALGPGGRHALSGSADRTLRLWEVATGRCLALFEGHGDVVTGVCLTGDGRFAVSGSADRTVRLWDVAGGRCLLTLAGHADPVHSVALSPDGRCVLSAGAQFLVRSASERIFTSGQLKLWELATGRCLRTFEGQTDAVTAVSLGADGRLALSGAGQSLPQQGTGKTTQSGPVSLWDVGSGERLALLEGHGEAVTSVALSADGRYAVSGSTDRTLKLWDLAQGTCLRTFAGHGDAVTAVALCGDGRYAISASADRTLRLWVLDWQLEESAPADWDEGARPYLETFLTRHTPYAAALPAEGRRKVRDIVPLPLSRWFRPGPTEEEIAQALARHGRPSWSEEDFEELLHTLGCAGLGWLRPQGVRRQLEEMAGDWQGPPPLIS